MRRLRAAAGVLLVCLAVYFGPLLLLSSPQHGASWSVNSSGQIERQAIAELLEQRLRHLHQNDFSGSTVPPKFTQLDRAAETQRIYRSVAVERNATAKALQNPTAAWQRWLVTYNVTYSSRKEADYRRQVWMSNLQRADKLNQLVGPEVAFGINRFSELTPEEFIQLYTGDAQKDSGIIVTPQDPQMLNSTIAPLLADWAAGTFLTPKGDGSNDPGAVPGGGSNGSSATNMTVPGVTGPPAVAPPPQGGANGTGGGGGLGGPGAGTPAPGSSGGSGGITGPLQPPTVRPPGGTVPPTTGTTPPPAGTTTPPPPGVTPPPGFVTPPTIVPPGQQTPPPGGAGATTPPPSPSPAPPGAVTPPIVRPPGVSIPVQPISSSTPTPSPSPSPSPAPGASPPPSPPPPPSPSPSPSPAPGASPSPASGTTPSPSPSPSPPPGVRPGAPGAPGVGPGGIGPPPPGVGPGGVGPPPPGVGPGGVGPPPGVGPGGGTPPGAQPGPPVGRRRRQLLELQLEQLIIEEQQQQRSGTDGEWEATASELVLPALGRSGAEQQQQQLQQHQQQWEGDSEGSHQLGHGNYLVLRGMAGVVKQAWYAWGALLSRYSSSSSNSAAATRWAFSDSSDAAVGSTPSWHDSGLDDEEQEGWDINDGSGPLHDNTGCGGAGGGRQLQQAFVMSNTACSKQVPWQFGKDQPMASVDWLRQGVVAPGLRQQSNCSNSFVYVAASLAETTMALLGYSGTAKRLSEAQMMACMPDASCSRAGTVHVLLNSLACGGFAAAATGPNAFPISDPATAATMPQTCRAGDFNPVETGLTGWSFVPATEVAFAQALSRTPIKVSVDATMLQSYRAGFIGCNVQSSIANHAMLAVGYNQRVRAKLRPGSVSTGPQRDFEFYTGGSYWMLRGSWGTQGSVDGYVYVAKGCGGGGVAPLGLLANRGVMPLFNASDTAGVGRLQCYFPGDTPDPGCDRNLLLRLSSFCAKVDDFLHLRTRTNCSCSCVPV